MHERQTNALLGYDAIERRLDDRRTAVFLDYDGTLTPIVDRPELAVLSPGMRSTLQALATRCTVAIVSGRDRGEVEKLVGLETVSYAGSHGFDIAGPAGVRWVHETGYQAAVALDLASAELKQELAGVDGCIVERKQYAVAVHYRLVPEPERSMVFATFDRVAVAHPGLVVTSGKMVLELRPDVEWNKGAAVLWLLQTLGLDSSAVVPIFLGDDITDEDAFEVLSERGIGILVADTQQPSHARYSLKSPDEAREFLNRLIHTLDSRP